MSGLNLITRSPFSQAVHFPASRRALVTTTTFHCVKIDIHSDCFSSNEGGKDAYRHLDDVGACLVFPLKLVAQTALKAGHYVLRNTPHDLFVNSGTEVILNIRFKPLETCPYTLDAVLRYELPQNYDNTPINYTSAKCNSTIDCGGEVFKCVNPTRPIPASFSQTRIRRSS